MNWSDTWELEESSGLRSGGQGRVCRVRNRQSGQIAALKVLHDQYQRDREKRYRLHAEVEALHLLDGKGVPAVFASNSSDWQRNEVDLYVVLEWVSGPTLGEFIQGNGALELTAGLDLALLLVKAVESLHELGIHHRDIKPDNIILRGSDAANPVILDFGQAWRAQPAENDDGFETEVGQEMGNRFLRLPEHAPGGAKRDLRSDATLLVGVLFFLLSGQAPRVLRDARDRPPHEVLKEAFLRTTLDDHRWSSLERLFRQGFQVSLESRIPSAAALGQTLTTIRDLPNTTNDLGAAMNRLQQAVQSDPDLISRERQALMEHFANHFAEELNRHAGSLLSVGDRSMTFVVADYAVSSVVRVKLVGSNRAVGISHRTALQGTSFVCQYMIGEDSPTQYHMGPTTDPQSLQAASSEVAPSVVARVANLLADQMLA